MNIWLLEDDPAQAELLSHWLVEAGHVVTHYGTGAAIKDELGRGGFGVVFKATQLGMNRPVALKILLPQAASVDTVQDRFKRV